MELVLTGAARRVTAHTTGPAFCQRAGPLDQISHYRVRPHVERWDDSTAILPCQKFG